MANGLGVLNQLFRPNTLVLGSLLTSKAEPGCSPAAAVCAGSAPTRLAALDNRCQNLADAAALPRKY